MKHSWSEVPCDVGRKLGHKREKTPPCPEMAGHRIVYDDDGTGQPLAVHVCDIHLPILAPSKERVPFEFMCMAGRQLTGAPGWEFPCKNKATEIVHVIGDEDGGFVLDLCDVHRAQLPAEPIL